MSLYPLDQILGCVTDIRVYKRGIEEEVQIAYRSTL